jgi:alpha/beta superfamily hydrolase
MTLMIPARSVALEAVLREPQDLPLRAAAVLCHPHPLFGGTMNNRVVFRAGKGVLQAGLAALRFNFRGVGASTGSFDEGE